MRQSGIQYAVVCQINAVAPVAFSRTSCCYLGAGEYRLARLVRWRWPSTSTVNKPTRLGGS